MAGPGFEPWFTLLKPLYSTHNYGAKGWSSLFGDVEGLVSLIVHFYPTTSAGKEVLRYHAKVLFAGFWTSALKMSGISNLFFTGFIAYSFVVGRKSTYFINMVPFIAERYFIA